MIANLQTWATRLAQVWAVSFSSLLVWSETRTPTLLRCATLGLFAGVVLGHGVAHAIPRLPRTSSRLLLALGRRVYDSPLTFTIVAIHLGIFVTLDQTGGADAVRDFYRRVCTHTDVVHSSEWWRLFTSGWGHLDWEHVSNNCRSIVIYGLLLEPAVGSLGFGALYVLSTLGAGVAGLLFETGRGAGASGAVFGMMGALIVCRVFTAPMWACAVWLWAAIDVSEHLGWLESTEISNGAHVGGLVAGALVGGFLRGRPLSGFFGSRTRRALAGAAVAAALMIAVGMDPQWAVSWQRNQAMWSSPPGKPDAAECHWEQVEQMADPTRPVEASLVADAAEYRIDHDQIRRARGLYESIGETMGSEARTRIATLQAWYEPYDDSAAVAGFIRSIVESKHSAETMSCFADLLLWTEDESFFRPEEAVRWARYAVIADRDRHGVYQQTLAWAYFACGERKKAVRALRRAIELSPGAAGDYQADLVAMSHSCRPWSTVGERDRWWDEVQAHRLGASTDS